jgi:hypothetical protein
MSFVLKTHQHHPTMYTSSAAWAQYFRENLEQQRIDWAQQPNITNPEKNRILRSLQAWQLGETSDGAHLLRATRLYAGKINDPDYVEAVTLFIREEQKHGSNLGRYLDLVGEPRISSDWGDSLFRKVRYFNTSMEIWTATVIIVESFAQIFYQALSDATRCNLLKSICGDILQDEKQHIRFQLERLQVILCSKSFVRARLSLVVYRVLFEAILAAVWIGHKKAFRAGGYDFIRYSYSAGKKFRHIESQLLRAIHGKRTGDLNMEMV